MPARNERGKYLQFDWDDTGNLLISLNEEGRALKELLTYQSSEDCWEKLIEDFLLYGWERLTPEELELDDENYTYISEEAERDQDGRLLNLGVVYYHADPFSDAVEVLFDEGEIVFNSLLPAKFALESSHLDYCGPLELFPG